jgi:SAM-dependent methyltransferase
MPPYDGTDFLSTLNDDEFDRLYPAQIQRLSPRHWTPVKVARKAAKFLVQHAGVRVLDVGCGPGKFCAIGAVVTEGYFTGIEQRPHLVAIAREMIRSQNIPRVEIIHGNVTDVRFSDFDAFYIYNPFQENIVPSMKIDSKVEMEPELYATYTEYVERELAAAPMGTRVVTYMSQCEEIPACYECARQAFGGFLKLWIKMREAEPVSLKPEVQFVEDRNQTSMFPVRPFE